MRRNGLNDTGSSGNTNLTLWQIIWKKNREKRRFQDGKLRYRTRNQSRNSENVRSHARKSLRSMDATGKTREMDVPVSWERNALYGFRFQSRRHKHDRGQEPGRHYLQTASDVPRDSASGKASVHMDLGEIFAVWPKDQRAG